MLLADQHVIDIPPLGLRSFVVGLYRKHVILWLRPFGRPNPWFWDFGLLWWRFR
jgi:hypothetical protein